MSPQPTNKNEREQWSGSLEESIQGPLPETGDTAELFDRINDHAERNRSRRHVETHAAGSIQPAANAAHKIDRDAMAKRLDKLRQDLETLILNKTMQVQQELRVNEESQIDYNHPADSMEGGEDRDRHLRLVHHAQSELKLVLDAINRLHANTFGMCQSCGSNIQADRLHAIPYTPLCINCQIEEVEEKRGFR